MFDVGEVSLSSRIATKKLAQYLSSKAVEVTTIFTHIVIVSKQYYTITLIWEQYYSNRVKCFLHIGKRNDYTGGVNWMIVNWTLLEAVIWERRRFCTLYLERMFSQNLYLSGTSTWPFSCCLLRTDLLTFTLWKPKYRQQITSSKTNDACLASRSPALCLEEVVSKAKILWCSFLCKWKKLCSLNCIFAEKAVRSEGCTESSAESSQPFKSGSVFDCSLKNRFVLLILWIIKEWKNAVSIQGEKNDWGEACRILSKEENWEWHGKVE